MKTYKKDWEESENLYKKTNGYPQFKRIDKISQRMNFIIFNIQISMIMKKLIWKILYKKPKKNIMGTNVINVMSKGSDSPGLGTMWWMAYTYKCKTST